MAIWRRYDIITAKRLWFFIAIYTIILLAVFLTLPKDYISYYILGGKLADMSQTPQRIKNGSTKAEIESITQVDQLLTWDRYSSVTVDDTTNKHNSGISTEATSAAISTAPPTSVTTLTETHNRGTSGAPTTQASTCKDPDLDLIRNNNRFVCCQPVGGLGNNMFIYASCYGLAAYYNRTLVFPKSSMLTKYFKLNAHIIQDNCACNSAKFYLEKYNCGMDPALLNLSPKENIKFGYYLQSWKYFVNVMDDIRRQYTLSNTTLSKARDIISKLSIEHQQRTKRLFKKQPVLVGIHVRRGDINSEARLIKFGYELATPGFFSHAMQYFRKKYAHVLFLVCSLEMDWTKWYVTGDDIIYVEGNEFITDMAVLLSCDHTVTSVGSFSWWVGFLNGGETVYYQWPAREGSELRKQFSANYSDYFLPEWIGLK
ncbi:galactoside alpha-(1,2)-fucosyltransferase 2-like isoform X2 [Haliotis rubra]|uniref:galactoside alpha-(1,2)-fucosyltransferase 2-like isoform X2 n=1 Tax=Haliotis rubra TaxID=36100 RepID=UPI001EE54379|nr:galactoside alpha-(1,2)-fucosyltransferase 2-like isoform X2 [Haliotis rubra]